MSNGLLRSGAGFGGWDTTLIQSNNNNITNIDSLFEDAPINGSNNNSKLKPYKNQRESQAIDENTFISSNEDKNKKDTPYMNPFSFDYEAQNESNQVNEVNQVFDLLFDTNNNTTNNKSNNNAFYSFDFGAQKSEDHAAKNDKLKRNKTQSSDSQSHSSDSDSHSHSDGDVTDSSEKEKEKEDESTLKISPPTKQSARSKKRRNSTKTPNERAFEALDTKLFDPSLINKVPISEIHSAQQRANATKHKKRKTEPVNIHSERQKQLKEEGLIPSPSTSPRKTKKTKKEHKVEQKPKKSLYNVLPELHRGTALLKYGRRGYPHFRQFNLTADNQHLRWFSSKKKLQQSSINVGSIDDILTGQHTKEFRRIAWTTLTPASFSIIYNKKKKSLNLVAKSVDEMKMWVQALRTLRDLKRKGDILSKLDSLQVQVDFRDRNRPQSRHHSGAFLRSHETKERQVDAILQRKLIDDIASLRKQFIQVSREANNPIVHDTKEYESIEQILSELEERIEELDHEVRNTRNTKIAENDVWRTRIDLESLREKIKVINKQHKAQYKHSKRRWSVF